MRRKGTPCACDCDPCKGKNSVRAINNVSPDPNGDFEIKAGNGIGISQSGDNSITIINQAMASSFVAGDNIEINPSGDDLEIRVTDDISVQDIDASGNVNIGGTLNVAGDIIQQGAAYETHAEKIYTTNDYIYMRDGAVGGLAVGAFSGFQVEKYDGTNDGRLVIDNSGTARVGDVGDEQPLLTRDENADLTDGHLLEWDANNSKAVDSGTDVSAINTAINGKVSGTGNIGNDTSPVKIVNGIAVASARVLVPFNVIKDSTRYSHVDIGSGNNVLMMSAFNTTIEARLVIVAEGTQCRLQLEKWNADGSSMISNTTLASI